MFSGQALVFAAGEGSRSPAGPFFCRALTEGKIHGILFKLRTYVSGAVLVSTGAMQLVKLSVCNALNGKPKYKR